MKNQRILSNSEVSAFCGQLSLIVKAGISLQEGLLIMAEDDKGGRGGEIIEKLTEVMEAGGSFATAAWSHLEHPVAVEHIQAAAGMDIGGTLIGMHLRDVAVPTRLSIKQIGEAILICARTRPKFIGGERAHYNDGLK